MSRIRLSRRLMRGHAESAGQQSPPPGDKRLNKELPPYINKAAISEKKEKEDEKAWILLFIDFCVYIFQRINYLSVNAELQMNMNVVRRFSHHIAGHSDGRA